MSESRGTEGSGRADRADVGSSGERRSFLKRMGLWSLVALAAPLLGLARRAVAGEDAVRVRGLADPSGPTPQSCEGTTQCERCHWACNHTVCS